MKKLLPLLFVLLLAATPALAANTYPLFARVYRTVTNLVLQSNTLENASWEKEAGVTAADSSASCPTDGEGYAMSLVTSGGNAIKQDVANTPSRSVYLARPTAGSNCGLLISDYSGDNSASYDATGTAVNVSAYNLGDTGIKVKGTGSAACGSWCMSSVQLENRTAPSSTFCGPTTTTSKTCKVAP